MKIKIPAMADPIAIPDPAAVLKAVDLDILNVKGDKIKFGSIFDTEKVIVVFIRLFFPLETAITAHYPIL